MLRARRWRLLLCVLVLGAAPAGAEQMFVTDKLVLNVYAEPDQQSERLDSLETGDSIEVIEQLGNFFKVQLADGREGWVGASYLTNEAPALVKLRNLEKEQKAAAQKVERELKARIDTLEKQNAELALELKTVKETPPAEPASPEPAAAETIASTQTPAVAEPERCSTFSAFMWAPFVLLAGGAGFAAGYQTLARKIRNKFGGVKIY